MLRTISLGLVLLAIPALISAAEAKRYTKNVAILLYNGIEVLDFAGPAEVFQSAARFGAKGEEQAFHLYTVSRGKAPIVSQGFIRVTPDYSIEDSPKPDILILPGGGSEEVTDDAAWMQWIKTSGRDAEHVLTVCTGAFIAARAGLLDGLDATTWYNAIPALTREFPNIRVLPGRRFVDNGKMITTAGVSAGIDGSLHLVARLLGRYVADRTAEYMEYKWAPESYLSAKYAQLNPQLDARGRAKQQASIAVREGNSEAAVAIFRSLLAEDRNDGEAWLNLGRALHDLEQYAEAIAAHQEAAKAPPQRARALYNIACEYALSGDRDKAIDAVAQAIEGGYRTRSSYENDSDFATIRDDPRFQALVAKL